MGTYRLYTGEDSQSHIESIELAKAPDWAQGLAATQISFQEQLDLPAAVKQVSTKVCRVIHPRVSSLLYIVEVVYA